MLSLRPQFFWDGDALRQLLPAIDPSGKSMAVMSAYEELLTLLSGRARGQNRAVGLPGKASGAMADEVRETIARKTYREKISWAHMIKNYRRVYSFHLVALHAMIAIAASEGVWHWRYVSTATLTHAVFCILMAAVGLWAGDTGWRARLRELLPWYSALPCSLSLGQKRPLCSSSHMLLA